MEEKVIVTTTVPPEGFRYKHLLFPVVFITLVLVTVFMGYTYLSASEPYIINNNKDDAGNLCEPDRTHDADRGNYYRGCGLPVITKQVTSPGKVLLDVDAEYKVTATGNINIIYVNKFDESEAGRIAMPLGVNRGIEIKRQIEYDIPEGLPEGEYYIRFITDVKYNWVRPMHKETQSLTFSVVTQWA